MIHLANHATDAGIVFDLSDLRNLVQTEVDECFLLVYRIADTASDLLNLYLCHS